jgi:putative ABC transport system ATP-binding protein
MAGLHPALSGRPEGTAMSIELQGVWKTYGQGPAAVHALRALDLSIPRGELVVILGPSGSGKTTLLNLIGALDRPTGGSIHVDGTDLAALDEEGRVEYRRTQVGFVFQFFNLIPTLTARENVELVAELVGREPLPALQQVGLEDRMDHFPAQLSGGEQQRVAIARALANDPPILIGDEITGELDSKTGFEVMEIVAKLNQEQGTTVVYVTHDPRMAKFAGRVIQLRDGLIAEDNGLRA